VGEEPRRVTLGRIAGVFGVLGWLKVHSYTRPPDNILEYPRWWIAGGQGFEAQLVSGRVQGKGLVAQITGLDGRPIADRDAAAALVGADIAVERSELPEPEPGSYYWADLIGLRVVSTAGEPLGEVSGVMENGAQDVLEVRDGARERLIPFVPEAIIKKVDRAAGQIVAEWAPDY
jgi:16S rRNA processing protein RimM